MKSINKEHLTSAIKYVDKEGVPSQRKSLKYDLIYKGKSYPPLYIVSLANKYAEGAEIPPNTLSGGPNSEAFELLDKYGFQIIDKNVDWKKDLGYQQQIEFQKEWPIERIYNLTLEEYTNLDRETSFTYWIEKRTESTGSIWGGSAYKFGIYRRKNTEDSVDNQKYTTDGIYAGCLNMEILKKKYLTKLRVL